MKLSDRGLNYVHNPAFVWGPEDKHENMSELSVSGQKLEMVIALVQARCRRQITEFRTIKTFSQSMKFLYVLDT